MQMLSCNITFCSQVIDVSGAAHLQKILPNCKQVDIIPRCGHSIGTDRPGAMTKAIKVFRQAVNADKSS